MRRCFWFRFFTLAGLILGGTLHLTAQQPATPRQFNEEFAVSVPAGWTETTLVSAPPDRSAPGDPFQNPDTLAILLQAKPADASRNAQVTILRDYSFGPYLNHMAKRDIQMLLSEVAMLKGYRTEKFSSKGSDKGVKWVLLGEVVGISLEGHRRVFSCIAFKQEQKYSVRVHFEYDETDAQARSEIDTLINSITSKNVRIADALSGQASMEAVAQSTPAPSPPVASSGNSSTDPAATGTPKAPTASTSPPPVAAGPLSEKTRLFVEKYRNSLVVVEGQQGKGSGFVCLLDGQSTVLTNTHVLAGNPQPRFTTMDGISLQPTGALLGVDHDICKLAVPDAAASLEVMGAGDIPKIGDAIAVLGNSEGAGVIKPLEGTIVGIGPNLIEVNAPFVPGNSGSPIIHLDSGKVIGIATYLIIRKVDESKADGMGTDVRRFGYRIDSVKAWEPVVWPRFYAQADQVKKILSVGEEFAQFLAFLEDNKRGLPSFGNSGVRRAVETFQNRLTSSRRMSEADMDASRREFLGNLRVATRSDLATFDNRTAYDYFRRQVADETRFRDALYQAFTKALDRR